MRCGKKRLLSLDKSMSAAERIQDLQVIADKVGYLDHEQLHELEQYVSDQQIKFVQAYVLTHDGKASAIRAGYKPEAASTMAGNILREPRGKLYYHELMKLQKINNTVTASMLVAELKGMAFFDPMSCFEFDSMGKPKVLPEQLRKAGKNVKAIKYNIKSGNLELQFYDRHQAIDTLAKHIGFYEKDNEQKKTDVVAIFLPDNNRTKDVEYIDLPIDEN